MIGSDEIARFRKNLNCHLRCDWYEVDGTAKCAVCGSGFTAAARKILKKLYQPEPVASEPVR